ncbi:MAG: arylsulfatase [Breznakia sp.]
MKKPNILLLMCDQFRGDTLSYKKHPDVQTPHLDTLAAQGVSFQHAYSSCPSCIPARVSLFTGKSQRNHGRVGYEDGISWNFEHMFPQLLSDHGYQSKCVGKMHVHPIRKSCGFASITLHDGYLGYYRSTTIPHYQHQEVSDDYLYYLKKQIGQSADVSASGLDANSWVTHPWIYKEHLHPTNWAVDESIRFLNTRDREKPFFLMTSFVRPHPPFDAPQSYYDIYKNKQLQDAASGNWKLQNTLYGDTKDSIFGNHHPSMTHDAMAGYYASITHVDHQIGRLLTSLQEDGSYDNTIIIFLSDHGEMLFDHGLFRKVFPYEGSTHIPLIFSIGKNVQAITPHASKSIVELRDIMPTILDFANISTPSDVDGLSLYGEIADNKKIERSHLHGEHSFHSDLSNHFIVTNKDKYIWYSQTGTEQYFHLQNDPKETYNAIDDAAYKTRIQQLRNILIDELKDCEEGYSDGTKLIVGKTPQNIVNSKKD